MDIASKIVEIIHNAPEATDLHIRSGGPILTRKPEGYVPFDDEVVDDLDISSFLSMKAIAGNDWNAELHRNKGKLSGAVDMSNNRRIRYSVYEAGGKEKQINIILRLIRGEPIPLADLGSPKILTQFAEKGKGLIIITGPTGSGKTTTMASVIDYINSRRSYHIMTIEDPIEYTHLSKKSVISQREVGVNLPSFADGLEGAMRQRPDVIAVGELLDRETVDTMFRAADSGHLVMATTHGRSAKDVINRLLGFFSKDEREQRRQILASCLTGIICQALVPSTSKKEWVLASEALANTAAIASAIAKDELAGIPNLIQQGKSEGMLLLNDDLSRLVAEKKISSASAKLASYDEATFSRSLF